MACALGRHRFTSVSRRGALALAAAFALAACDRQPDDRAFQSIDITGADWGRDFRLLDADGRSVQLVDFRGRCVLLFFGFKQCPDVCPTALDRATDAMRHLGPQAARLQVIVVTVDPERDTPAALAEFTDSFHPRLLGLTGSREQIDAALKAFRIYAQKVPGTTPDAYNYDHLDVVYLMDPEGRPVQFISGPTVTRQTVAQMLERFLV